MQNFFLFFSNFFFSFLLVFDSKFNLTFCHEKCRIWPLSSLFVDIFSLFQTFYENPILQVSLSTDDPDASTTLLFESQDDLERNHMSGETTALSAPADAPNSGAYSPLPARRGNSDTDRRRMSLAQRRQSNTQVKFVNIFMQNALKSVVFERQK